MLFHSLVFPVFLIVFLSLYYALPHRWQNYWLIAGSMFFYGWWDFRFLLLLGVSALVDYVAALRIAGSSSDSARKRWLAVSIFTNLGILGFFKYFNFFIDNACSLLTSLGLEPNVPTLSIILPVGISFYTFQTMSYTIDVYRRELAPTRNFANHFLYVCFFPQLVAGPIERASSLLPQVENPRRIRRTDLAEGSLLMFIGYFKKVAVADTIAPIVTRIFSAPEQCSQGTLLIGLYCFGFQLYADFSGYSDIARGVAQLMGFHLRINFNQPFFSSSITEFWRRWHISLSVWLKDYLYIPLGGNRHGTLKTYRNMFLTMILASLWHGASWNFVLRGLMHGAYLCVHKSYLQWKKRAFAAPAATVPVSSTATALEITKRAA